MGGTPSSGIAAFCGVELRHRQFRRSLPRISAYAESGGRGEVTGFAEATAQYHRALEAFIEGDPDPVLKLWSKSDDATLANPFGPPVRGR